MGATFWVILLFYLLILVGEGVAFSLWGLSRKNEDDYWRWIFALAGGAIFATIFWISYWLGTHNAWWFGLAAVPAVYIWMYLVFSTRSKSTLDRIVFSAFGTMVVFTIFAGGYNAGLRGWWGMSFLIYFFGITVPYKLLVPD